MVLVETSCAICGVALVPDHFRLLHPKYATFRARWWKILGLYFLTAFGIPITLGNIYTEIGEQLLTLEAIWLAYIFVSLALLVGARLWVEKHYRDIWKQEHPIGRLGLRVQITIEGHGSSNTLALPLGTVMGMLKGTDRGVYLGIQLDNAATVRDKLGEDLELSELAVRSRRGIRPLDEIITNNQLAFPVQIVKPAIPLNFNEASFDPSQAVYFALGEIKSL